MSHEAGFKAGIRGELAALFQTAITTAYPDAADKVALVPCQQAKFGDYQCNNAMALHGKLKGKENAPKAPRNVAEAILASLPPNDLVVETSLAGPGFINIKVSRPHIAKMIGTMLVEGIDSWAPRQGL